MARFKARVFGLVTVSAIAIGLATLFIWQEQLSTVQAAQEDSIYVVGKGDSLYSIAKKFDVSIEALAAANGLPINAPLNKKLELIIPGADLSTGSSSESADAAMQMDASAASGLEEATTEPTEEMMQEAAVEATEESHRRSYYRGMGRNNRRAS